MKRALVQFIIALCFTFAAFESSSQVAQQMSLETMNKNLLKIKQSIEQTKKRIKTIKDARFLPELYFALGEFYVEQARFMYAIKIAENPNTPMEELDFTAEKRPKLEAIQVYNTLIDKFPKLPDRDKAIFFKAHEQREMGLLEDMIRSYSQLTREYPSSPYWAESQIIIGDYFFENKKDVDLAIDVYKKILKKKPSPFTPLAHYKLGWCYINKTWFKSALLSFEKTLTHNKDINLDELPELYKKTDVRRDALLAMVWPYSELKNKTFKKIGYWKKDPLKYFFNLAPDKISYQKVLSKLGGRLTIKHRHQDASRVYFELLRIINDTESRLDITEKLYVSVKNTLKPWPLRGFVKEAARTVTLVQASPILKKAQKKKAYHDIEIFARDMATRNHKLAKRTGKKKDLDWAILDYETYLWAFPKNKHTLKIKLNLSEAYFNAKRFVEGAKAYEDLARRVKNPNRKKDFLDSSIEAYITALRDQPDLSRLKVTEVRYGLRTVGSYFIKKYNKDKAVPDIMFNIGQTYYDERYFDQAIDKFKSYIKNYPNHSKVEIAANLILDANNQRENYKALIKDGKELLADKNIKNRSLKRQISDIIQQAEMKYVQAQSGEFGTSKYASNLLRLARKYKGSSLGDKALFEAFIAFKSKKDPRAYQSGEQLILQHGNSKYAQQVVTEMGQMALTTGDFRKAAIYFELFSEKYPSNKESHGLLKNAAKMRELMGDYKLASIDYRKLHDYSSSAKMDYLAQDWTSLARSAPKASGIKSIYWEGLATYRLKGIGPAHTTLLKASQMKGGGYEENEMSAHALYLLAMGVLKRYNRIQMRPGRETRAVNDKSNLLKELTKQLNQVIQFGNGRWTIAALYGLGLANKEFSSFIKRAPIPKGLTKAQKAQYKTALSQQAQGYSSAAKDFFRQCLVNAEKYEVFTTFVQGCQSLGKAHVNEAKETQIYSKAREKAPPGAKRIRLKLFDDPRNVFLLHKLAQLHVKSKDYSMSELILNRILEIKPNNPTTIAQIGVIYLYKNDLEQAKQWFKKALKINNKTPLAMWGMAGLYKKFGFKSKLRTTLRQARRAKRPGVFLHPYIQQVL